MKTEIIPVDRTYCGEPVAAQSEVEEHARIFRGYREKCRVYNAAKKVGQTPKPPKYPFVIRVCERDGLYHPADESSSMMLAAARKAEINRIKVIVEDTPAEQADSQATEEPIRANLFFDDFKTALRRLTSTDEQRIVFFQPLFLAMVNEGFSDGACRAEFLKWAKHAIDRYSI